MQTRHLRLRPLILALCAFSCSLASAAPPAESLLKTAEALRAEAEQLAGARLRQAVQERAAALYRHYADTQSGPAGARALLQAGQLYLDQGGDDNLARALECAILLEHRPDGAPFLPEALLMKSNLFRRQKEWGRAVRTALDCADRFPRHECAPRALFEAAQLFETSIRNPSEAETQYGRILAEYPHSPMAPEALMARAGLRTQARQYPEAIADCLAVADDYPDCERADQALFDAITLYDSRLRDFPKAYELCVRFRTQFPHSSRLKRVEQIETRTLKYVSDSQR